MLALIHPVPDPWKALPKPVSRQQAMQRVDELMLLFLKTTDQAEERLLLEQIVGDHARPIVTQIIRAKLRLSALRSDHNSEVQDSEDIVGDVVLQLVKRLRDAKSDPRKGPLNDVNSYVAVAACNAFNTYVRRKHPERWRLKDKVRYALTYQRGFSLWEPDRTRTLCGFDVWREEGRPSHPSGGLQWLRENPGELASIDPNSIKARTNLPLLVSAIFNWAGAPVEFGELVNLIADLWGLPGRDTSFPKEGHEPQSLDEFPAHEPGLAKRVEQRLYLERLWGQICELPLAQRRALLLNLRDAKGQDMTALFSHTRIATLQQLASALELSVEEFIRIYDLLPMEDASVAKYLELNRQQVINLRNSARRRLARRMKKLEDR